MPIIHRRRSGRGIPSVKRNPKADSEAAIQQMDVCFDKIKTGTMDNFADHVAKAESAVVTAGGQGQFRSRYNGFSPMTALRAAANGNFGPAQEIIRKWPVPTAAPV